MMALLTVNQISKSFENREIIDQIDLHVEPNEIVSLLGVSGAGKTTLFNIIAGLNRPDTGDVLLNGHSIISKPGQVSYMLQNDLLMDYRKVIDNVILPLLIQKKPKTEARKIAEPLLKEFGLGEMAYDYPMALSGGMRQRAALLRTYLFQKPIALLDEPFSALDALTKHSMHQWYLGIIDKLKMATLLVTHDIDEALVLSNRIYVLAGTPSRIAKEIKIPLAAHQQLDFDLSDQFLQYKRDIMRTLQI